MVYLVGGVDLETNQTSNRVLKYDVKARKWSEMPEMLEARKQPIIHVVDDYLIA